MWLTPYRNSISRAWSASSWETFDRPAAPKTARVLSCPVRPNNFLAIIAASSSRETLKGARNSSGSSLAAAFRCAQSRQPPIVLYTEQAIIFRQALRLGDRANFDKIARPADCQI